MSTLVAETASVALSQIVFREDLYPRIKTSPETVQKYAEDLSVLPPIEVNQRYELIDGWHRWTAHKNVGAETIPITVTETASDSELLEFAIERNATHGLQLSQADKEKFAGRLYKNFLISRPSKEECVSYKGRLARMFSVSPKSIDRWTTRDDKDHERELEEIAFEMWLKCETQEVIAEAVGWSRPKVTEFVEKRQVSFCDKPLANHTEESFHVPLYNIWKQQEKTAGSSHYGNSEIRWVDNLLYLYTRPFDVVVDAFAGSGSTLDICRKRFRRCWVSDRRPIVERENEIRTWDVKQGAPPLPRWKDVRLVYLDPPYWKQAEGRYSNDPEDLANMPLEQFSETLANLIRDFAKKLTSGFIALVIQPTQWNAPNHEFTDHVKDMLCRVKLPVDMRFSAPYESQQYNAQMVEWAKANRKCLVLTREIIVWRVD